MTTSRYGRIIIWITSVALGVFAVACVFWTPFDRLKLLRPIPANAILVSSHYNLGSRLESMTSNIFLKAFFESNETAFKNLRENHYTVRILSSRLMVMAYVPDFNQFAARGAWSSHPALVISSWVGGWSPVLRWALWIHPPKDIVPLGDYNGHRLWAYKKPASCFGTVNYFSFAIDEGIFIGCLSQDRNGVVYLLKNSDGRKDSILNVSAFNPCLGGASGEAWASTNGCSTAARTREKDQVWLRVGLPSAAQNKSFFAVCSLDALENDYLAATIRFEPDIQLNDYAGLNQNLAEIGKMYACSPSMAALFPSDMVADGLNGLTRPGGLISPTWSRVVKPFLSSSSGTNHVCLLMVFTGAYGGQFGKEPFRITVPTVLLAVSGSRQEQTKAAVLELLDLINLKHRLGLILNSTLPPAGQCPVFAVESTSRAPLNSLPVEDQPAFAFYNDWFLLASNSAGLRKILLNFQSQSVPAEMDRNFNPDPDRRDLLVGAEPPFGERRISSHGDATPTGQNSKKNHGMPSLLTQADSRQTKAFIRIDPGEGGKALRFALTASIIMLDADGLPAMPTRIALQAGRNPSKQNTIKILKAARSWLESISGLKNFAAWMESEDGKTVLHLEIGRKN